MNLIVFSQLFSNATVGGLSFLLNVFLARVLGVKGFGIYQFAITFGVLYALIQDAGFRTFIFREAAGKSPDLPYTADRVLRVALTHLVSVTCGGVLLFSFLGKTLLSLSIIYFGFLVWAGWISAYLKGTKAFVKESLWNVTFRALAVTGALTICLILQPEAKKALLGLAVGGGVGFLLSFQFVKGHKTKNFECISLIKLYPLTVPFLLIDFFTTIYFRADILMLKYLRSYSEVGYYAVCYRLFEAFIFLATPLMHIFFVRTRSLVMIDHGQARNLIRRGLFVSMLGGTLVWVFFTLAGENILKLLYGRPFVSAVPILTWLAGALVVVLPNYILTQSIIAVGEERFYVSAAGICAFLNIGLNFWFIPSFGATGAAFSTIITEVFLFILLLMKSGRCLGI